MPPPIDIDDRGVRWRNEGPVLHIERGPSLAAVALPIGVLLLVIAFAFIAWRDGDTGMVVAFGFITLLPLGLIAMRVVTRFQIQIDGTTVRWERTRPRPATGSWSRSNIDGLRYWVDPDKGSWFSRRHADVAMRVGGEWVTFASGLSKRRAHALTRALALATGMAPEYAGAAEAS